MPNPWAPIPGQSVTWTTPAGVTVSWSPETANGVSWVTDFSVPLIPLLSEAGDILLTEVGDYLAVEPDWPAATTPPVSWT